MPARPGCRVRRITVCRRWRRTSAAASRLRRRPRRSRRRESLRPSPRHRRRRPLRRRLAAKLPHRRHRPGRRLPVPSRTTPRRRPRLTARYCRLPRIWLHPLRLCHRRPGMPRRCPRRRKARAIRRCGPGFLRPWRRSVRVSGIGGAGRFPQGWPRSMKSRHRSLPRRARRRAPLPRFRRGRWPQPRRVLRLRPLRPRPRRPRSSPDRRTISVRWWRCRCRFTRSASPPSRLR